MLDKFNSTKPNPADFIFKFGNAVIGPSIADVAGKEDPRRFSGVAYTGDPIHRHPYWGTLVMDISLMKVPERMPILRDHDEGKVVGYSNRSLATPEGLTIEGILSKVTEHGKEVTALSDEGFPWQMSIRIDPSRIEEISQGATALVNGRSVDGPAVIFRESTLAETSFTPVGWDSGTSAIALSLFSNHTPKEDTTMSKELEDKAAMLSAELATRDTKITTLLAELDGLKQDKEAQAKEARLSRVKEFYKSINKEYTEADQVRFSKLDLSDAAVDAIIEMSRLAVPRVDPKLFSHQATGEEARMAENPGTSLVKLCKAKADEYKQK